MEKLNIITAEMGEKNIEMLGQLFPNCLTENMNEDGKIVKAIDFDKLRQELSDSVVEGPEERYQFTWPDKRNAIRLANAPTTKTLRPCREESVDFDNTENLYIEGDNLDVLKILRENYLGKIKMIYIDPPYNTGNDFVYNDDFSQTSSEYIAESGQFDSEGNRLVLNTESNGRFHTDWLNMMYPRLKVAKDLLSDDGVMFISIGQNEVANLTKLADEIFGNDNRINIVTRIMKSGGAKGHFFSPNIEFIIVYTKCKMLAGPFREAISQDIVNKLYTSVENQGSRKGERYRPFGLYQSSLDARPNQRYYIECPDGSFVIPPGETFPEQIHDGAKVYPNSNDGCWRWSCDRYLKEKANGNITFKKSNGVLLDQFGRPSEWNVYSKIWLSDRQEDGATPIDHISKWENRHSAKELQELSIPFDFAKPMGLIKYLIEILPYDNSSIFLDYFAGSSTTAHAVMKLNAEDNGHRKFIMVQLPEKTDEKSGAYKAGYRNICEIGKERIRRAGKKIKEEAGIHAQNLDIGFRVLKLDSANEKEVKRTPSEVPVEQGLFDAMLDDMVENIKEDRTPEDLLFQVLPMCNLPLSCKILTKEIDGKCVFVVEDGYLVACFDENINEEVITAIAKMKPYYFVMRDSSLATDNVADNFDQIFNAYSKDTIRRIL